MRGAGWNAPDHSFCLPLPSRPAAALEQISIIDARKFEAEVAGGCPPDEALEHCELLENKQGQPLLAHGRSGSYTDSKRVLVPMIHGQALLPDLKITDSSEALLTGRAPPFRLSVRAVHRSGEQFEGVAFALSEPFVVSQPGLLGWVAGRGAGGGVSWADGLCVHQAWQGVRWASRVEVQASAALGLLGGQDWAGLAALAGHEAWSGVHQEVEQSKQASGAAS